MSRKIRIGLLVDYVISEYSELLREGIRKACKKYDFELLIFSIGKLHNTTDSFDYQNAAITALASSKNLDGLIFISGMQPYLTKSEMYSYIKAFKPLPIINISEEITGVYSVMVACYESYKKLFDILIDTQRCSKIGIVSVRGKSPEAKIRMKYIKSILEEKGIDFRKVAVWKAEFSYASSIKELKNWYKKNHHFDFDAIICLNDEMALGAIDFCASIGKRVPEDIVVSGFDDLERSSFSMPSLTSINQKLTEQGYKAVDNLYQIINGNEIPKLTLLPSELKLRVSTCRNGYKKIGNMENVKIDIDYRRKFSSNMYETEWYAKKAQVYQVTRFYTDMQNDVTLAELRIQINKDIRAFGIKACAIVLYENPIEMNTPFDYFYLPHKAKLFAGFDELTNFDSSKLSKSIKFNPKEEILPEGVLQFDSEGMMVIALYHNTLQYGYIFLKPGDYDSIVYDLFAKMLSSLISSVYSFSLIHTETAKVRQKADKLDFIARTDELTGLNNRRGLYELGKITMEYAHSMKQGGMIIYCDMDDLKKINDTYGHEEGDRAIIAESVFLKSNFRSNDIIARVGGDEFALICPGLTESALTRIREQIEEDCSFWSKNNKSGFNLSISMGAVSYPSDNVGYNLNLLISEADSIMYLEKRRKKAKSV